MAADLGRHPTHRFLGHTTHDGKVGAPHCAVLELLREAVVRLGRLGDHDQPRGPLVQSAHSARTRTRTSRRVAQVSFLELTLTLTAAYKPVHNARAHTRRRRSVSGFGLRPRLTSPFFAFTVCVLVCLLLLVERGPRRSIRSWQLAVVQQRVHHRPRVVAWRRVHHHARRLEPKCTPASARSVTLNEAADALSSPGAHGEANSLQAGHVVGRVGARPGWRRQVSYIRA
eukprot:scaffold260_cov328-Prasinococcus_capsulatus_cf.AAC.5